MATVIIDTRSTEAKKMLEYLKTTRYVRVIEEDAPNDETISAINEVEDAMVNPNRSAQTTMLKINKIVLTNEENRPLAVQVDYKTFEKIEQVLEDYALGQLIEENDSADLLSLNEAKEFYKSLKKR